MSLLFSGSSSVTPWIQQSVCDALQTIHSTTPKTRLAQVIRREGDCFTLSDGKTSIKSFLENKQEVLPDGVNFVVRVSDWHVATTATKDGKIMICLVAKRVHVLGGRYGMAATGNPRPLEASVDVRRAIESLTVRPTDILPLFQRNQGNEETTARNKKNSANVVNTVFASVRTATNNVQSVPESTQEDPSRHQEQEQLQQGFSPSGRDMPLGNVEALLLNKQSVALLRENMKRKNEKSPGGLKGYRLYGDGVAFETRGAGQIKELIMNIRRERNDSERKTESNEARAALATTEELVDVVDDSQPVESNESAPADTDKPRDDIQSQDASKEDDDGSSEDQGIDAMLVTETPLQSKTSSTEDNQQFDVEYIHVNRENENEMPSENGDDEFLETQKEDVQTGDVCDGQGQIDEPGDVVISRQEVRELSFQRWLRLGREAAERTRPRELESGSLGGDMIRSFLIGRKRQRTPSGH